MSSSDHISFSSEFASINLAKIVSERARRPDLEALILVHPRRRVVREMLKPRLEKLGIQASGSVPERREHHLERRESLLPVDHFGYGMVTNADVGLVEDYRAEEVFPHRAVRSW